MTHWFLILALGLGACGGKKDDKVPPAATPTPTTPAPTANRAAPFWKWFTDHATALHANTDLRAVMESISAELEKAYPGVFAEIGKNGDELMLVISADGITKLFPDVQEVYAARPTVPGWKIVAFRQRDAGFAIEMNGKKIEPKTVKFVGTPGEGKLDIEVYLPGFKKDDEEMKKIGFIILDHMIGEYDMETKIGGIDFGALESAPATAKSLTELPAMVDAVK
jgi:hypothetical protein